VDLYAYPADTVLDLPTVPDDGWFAAELCMPLVGVGGPGDPVGQALSGAALAWSPVFAASDDVLAQDAPPEDGWLSAPLALPMTG